MKKLFLSLFIIGWVVELTYSQQLPLYSQYAYNKYLINPAHAGSDGFTSFTISAREQWIGYKGAPRTYSFSFQSRVLKDEYKLRKGLFSGENIKYVPKTDGRVGFGAYLYSDMNGLVYRTGIATSYSYHAWLYDYTQFSLGLGLSAYHLRIAATEQSFEDPSEPWLNDNMRKGVIVPDVDFGMYLLNPHFDIGFSAQQILGASVKFGPDLEAYRNYWMDRHYYIFGSYSFEVGVKTIIQPQLLFKMSEQVRPQVDIGATYIYDNTFWFGLHYRTESAFIGTIRLKVWPSRVMMQTVYIGYAFDYTTNQIQRCTYGSHEMVISLKFGASDKRFRWFDRY